MTDPETIAMLMRTKLKSKKPTLEDLTKLAHNANMRLSVELLPMEALPYTKAVCMVCRRPVPVRSNFNKTTGLGVCNNERCRSVFAELGCV